MYLHTDAFKIDGNAVVIFIHTKNITNNLSSDFSIEWTVTYQSSLPNSSFKAAIEIAADIYPIENKTIISSDSLSSMLTTRSGLHLKMVHISFERLYRYSLIFRSNLDISIWYLGTRP